MMIDIETAIDAVARLLVKHEGIGLMDALANAREYLTPKPTQDDLDRALTEKLFNDGPFSKLQHRVRFSYLDAILLGVRGAREQYEKEQREREDRA